MYVYIYIYKCILLYYIAYVYIYICTRTHTHTVAIERLPSLRHETQHPDLEPEPGEVATIPWSL